MAQIDSQSTEIGGVTYTVYPIDPMVANDILIEIGHVIGPSIGALAAAESDDDDADPDLVNQAIGGLFQRITKPTMRSIIDTLAKATEVRTDATTEKAPRLSSILAVHFRGQLGAMYQWLWFALKVQFGDFFALAVPAIDRARGLAGAASSSPGTSPTGGSSID